MNNNNNNLIRVFLNYNIKFILTTMSKIIFFSYLEFLILFFLIVLEIIVYVTRI